MTRALTWIALSVTLAAALLPAAVTAQEPVPTKPLFGNVAVTATPVEPTLAAPPVQIEETEALPDGSPVQLRVDYRPQLGTENLAPSRGPDYFLGFASAGGDKFIDLGDPCVAGYTSPMAMLATVWVTDSGRVRFNFTPDDPDRRAAMLIYDLLAADWWCNVAFFETADLTFDNLETGVYFIWVLAEQPELIHGLLDIYVDASQ